MRNFRDCQGNPSSDLADTPIYYLLAIQYFLPASHKNFLLAFKNYYFLSFSRALMISSKTKFGSELDKIEELLIENGYSADVLLSCINQQLAKLC